jgi:ribosomal protein L13
MLPKGVLGREYYKRLFIYSDNKINYVKTANGETREIPLELSASNNWIKFNLPS